MEISRIAVIGAGASGLTAIKSCLESGLNVTCFEQLDDFSGLWKYREEVLEGVAGCMFQTCMNTSKEMSAFSDFPPEKSFPNYMLHSYVYQYLSSYAEHFDLRRHIRFRTRLTSLEGECNDTGRWILRLENLENGKVVDEVFDAVMVCAGHHVYPDYPELEGIKDFQGMRMHSHDYKKHTCLENKRVAVIGLGNSGADIAVEASLVAEKVYLCSRKGAWIHPRIAKGGQPFNDQFYRRSFILRKSFQSNDTVFTKAEQELNDKFDHALYGLKPNHRIYNQYAIINDDLPNRILIGKVIPKQRIQKLTRYGIRFEDDPEDYPIDVMIFCTGYKFYYPFLDKNIVDLNNCPAELYRFVFPIRMKIKTLAFVGMIDPEGSIFNLAEIQSRWIMQVWTGRAKLPCTEWMVNTGVRTAELQKLWGNEGSVHQTRISWFWYIERIARYIGARPNLMRLLFTDPTLFWVCLTGPCLPYQYRINGPYAWDGARDAILGYQERMRNSFPSRILDTNDTKGQKVTKRFILIALVVLPLTCLVFKRSLSK